MNVQYVETAEGNKDFLWRLEQHNNNNGKSSTATHMKWFKYPPPLKDTWKGSLNPSFTLFFNVNAAPDRTC